MNYYSLHNSNNSSGLSLTPTAHYTVRYMFYHLTLLKLVDSMFHNLQLHSTYFLDLIIWRIFDYSLRTTQSV